MIRYRIPIEPLLVVMAAAFIVEWSERRMPAAAQMPRASPLLRQ